MARSRPRVIIRAAIRHGEGRIVNMSKVHRQNAERSVERQAQLDTRDLNRAIRDAKAWGIRKGKP